VTRAESPRPTTRGHEETLAALAVLALAIGLRWWGIGRTNLWLDETASLDLATLPVRAILENVRHSPLGSLYFLVLKGWITVFGTSPLALRAPSVLAGVAVVLGTYALGRCLFGRNVAIVAALFAAVSPTQLYYSQEARIYMLTAALAVATVAAYAWWRRGLGEGAAPDRMRASHGSAIALVAASAALVYAYPPGGLLFVALWVDALLTIAATVPERRPHITRAWVSVQAATAAACLPWLFSWDASTAVVGQGWRPAIGARSAVADLVRFPALQFRGLYIFPQALESAWYYYRHDPGHSVGRLSDLLRLAVMVPIATTVLIVCIVAACARGGSATRLLVLALAVPLFVLATLSARGALDLARYALFVSPFVMLLVAHGTWTLRGHARRMALAVLLLTLTLGVRQYAGVTSRDSDYRLVASLLRRDGASGDRVTFDPWYIVSPLRYYTPITLLPPDSAGGAATDARLEVTAIGAASRWVVVDYRAPDVFHRPAGELARAGEQLVADTTLATSIRVVRFAVGSSVSGR